jgi:hypothetical protein
MAAQLGYSCIARESLTDEATAQGIPIGRIETAIVKRQPLSEELELQVDRFKAHVTASLCERAVAGENLVYNGRTGHLVLPGVNHVFRVRAITPMEDRIGLAMARMNIRREKAKEYISLVFVIFLAIISTSMLLDIIKSPLKKEGGPSTRIVSYFNRFSIPPIIHFASANVTVSLWIVLACGLASGYMAGTIGVGGVLGCR